MSNRIRTYTELSRIESFINRYRYLELHSQIGIETFGFDRYLNQRFYRSIEWRQVRDYVIGRDRGCDLGVEGYEIFDQVAVHHMNPMTVEEVYHGDAGTIDPEFLVTVSVRTHNAIHFGDERSLAAPLVVRRPGDTKLW
jgi:hypothetical protein